mmetsp:Transcript_1752/g.4783  ORF Transcript_1752/g.4783 Transcript_1752/m.4783 type:complete len:249 (+) Transcript_1752:492-1238(+)
MNHLAGTSWTHNHRWLFRFVVAHHDNQIAVVQCAMHIIFCGQGAASQESGLPLIQHALAHLRAGPINARLIHKLSQCVDSSLAIGGGSNQDDGMFGGHDHLCRTTNSLGFGDGASRHVLLKDGFARHFSSNIFGQFHVYRSRFFRHGRGQGASRGGSQHVPRSNGAREFGNGLHHFHHIHNLKGGLFRVSNGLLPSDIETGKSTQMCKGSTGSKVGGTGSQGGQTNSRLTRHSTHRSGHEASSLLMTD